MTFPIAPVSKVPRGTVWLGVPRGTRLCPDWVRKGPTQTKMRNSGESVASSAFGCAASRFCTVVSQSSNDRHLLAACAAFGREGINPIQTIDTRQTHGRRAGRARPPLPFTDGIKELWSR